MQLSVTVRNARLDQVEATIGTAPTLKIFTGSAPTNCASADLGSVLSTTTLPSDWLAAAASGSKAMLGTWDDPSADATGQAGYFRIYSSGGTCHMQGSVSAAGGSGDMTLDNVNLTVGFDFKIVGFTLNDGNA